MSLPFVLLVMLLLASSVAMATRKSRIPYTVALVLTGLALSIIRRHFYPEFDLGLHLTRELLFMVLLPILVFEAAFHLELRQFLKNWKAITVLAVPGLVVGIAISGYLMHAGFGLLQLSLSLGGAFLMSAILAATDPVGVISLLRATSAPRRLAVVMEGESLLNDGVAVVAFAVTLTALGIGDEGSVSAGWLLRFLSWEVLGAALIGGGLGFFLSWLTSKVDDHLIEITLSTIGAFGSFILAEQVHSSGVLACLAAGMLTGNFGAKYGMSPTTRVAVVSFWEYAAFVANSIVFLLIGLEVDPAELARHWLAVLITWLAVLVARALFVGASLPVLGWLEGKLPRGSAAVVVWGGIRGGVAMVLALGIPRGYEGRELIVSCIFGASLLTILLQSTTMSIVLRRFGLVKSRAAFELVERLRGRWRAFHAAASYLEQQLAIGAVSRGSYDALRRSLAEEARQLEAERAAAADLEQQVVAEEERALRQELLMVRKEALRRASAEGAVDERVLRALVGELDEQLHALEPDGGQP